MTDGKGAKDTSLDGNPHVDIQGKIVEIPLRDVIEDVPVNDQHVKDLVESIREKGQAEPVLVWSRTRRIINGFHRVRAMNLLGFDTVRAILYDCDEEEFLSLRILSAVTHKSVHVARVVEWVQQSFAKTKWASMMQAQEAWRIGRRGSATHLPLTPSERSELTDWVRRKSREWNLKPERIGEILKIANISAPGLIREVRDEPRPGTLTKTMLETIATKLPRHDLQEGVVQKVRAEKLIGTDVQDLVERVEKAGTESERETLLKVPYQKPKKGRPPKSAVLELNAIRTKTVTDAVGQLSLTLPQLKLPQPFDIRLPELLGVIGRYLEEEDITALEILQWENQSLKEENKTQADEIARKDDLIATQRTNIEGLQQRVDSLIEELKRGRH